MDVAAVYVLVATRDATPEEARQLHKKPWKKGDIRVGSTGNLYQRLISHKRFGWLPIEITTRGMENPIIRFAYERWKSALIHNQSIQGEEYEIINGDFRK